MNSPIPPSNEAMQSLWNRAMLLERTRGAYGCAFPVPGCTYPLPTPGTMLHSLLFVCTASDVEYEAHLTAVRADMVAWKERVRLSSGKNKLSMVREVSLKGINLDNVEFKL